MKRSEIDHYDHSDVAKIFIDDLQLKAVADDLNAVTDAFDRKKERYGKNANSPDSKVAEKADEWFKRVGHLRKCLPEMLAKVQDAFELTLDTHIETLKASGVSTVPPQLRSKLEQIGKDQYHLSDDLARAWVEKFLKENNLEDGDGWKRDPELVSGLSATAGVGRIELQWTKPDSGCDAVRIMRSVAGGREREVFSGNASQYVDRDVTPGKVHRYRVYSLLGDVQSKGAQEVAATPRAPQAVTDLRATPSVRGIALQWKKPQRDCDEVRVTRRDQAGQERELFTDDRESFMDSSAVAGREYTYTVYSVVGGVAAPRGASVSCTAIGEVSEAHATWTGRAVAVRWTGPEGCERFFVLRATGAPPPLPADPAQIDAAAAWEGRRQGLDDENVAEGQTYFYRIVARYAGRWYSEGAVASERVPVAPPPPTDLQAAWHEGAVQLEWTSGANVAGVSYAVLRKEGRVAPRDPDDGTQVASVRGTSCRDAVPATGRYYSYAVFARQDGQWSKKGAKSEPVAALPDVTNLEATVGDGSVTLTWDTPRGADRVIVRRGLRPPTGPGSGVEITVIGSDRAHDQPLENDRTYHYLVCCEYSPGNGRHAFSQGRSVTATPVKPPEALTEVRARADGRRAIIQFEPVPHGTASFVRCAEPPPVRPNQRLAATKLPQFGTLLVATDPGMLVDVSPDPAVPFYASFVVAGDSAVAGPVVECAVAPPVENLQAQSTGNGVELRWDWPEHSTAVVVARRAGAWPSGPEDPVAKIVDVTRHAYRDAGGRYVDKPPANDERYHYVVYARVSQAKTRALASGDSDGERATARVGQRGKLKYRVELSRKLPLLGRRCFRVHWEGEDLPDDFAGFVIMGNHQHPPGGVGEGMEIYRWRPAADSPLPRGPQSASVPLGESDLREGRPRLYYRAFLLSETDSAIVTVMDPDISRPLALDQ